MPQAIKRLLPSQNGTHANPATKRAKNTPSVVIPKARLRGGFAASLRATPKLSVQASSGDFETKLVLLEPRAEPKA